MLSSGFAVYIQNNFSFIELNNTFTCLLSLVCFHLFAFKRLCCLYARQLFFHWVEQHIYLFAFKRLCCLNARQLFFHWVEQHIHLFAFKRLCCLYSKQLFFHWVEQHIHLFAGNSDTSSYNVHKHYLDWMLLILSLCKKLHTYIQVFIRRYLVKHISVGRLGRQILDYLVFFQLADASFREVVSRPEDQEEHNKLPPNHSNGHLLKKIEFIKHVTYVWLSANIWLFRIHLFCLKSCASQNQNI